MEPFIGQIIYFGGNFAPRGWAFCQGQLMSISQNTALFSILGTTYGGDGRTTYALPDLRGRVAISPGTGPGLTTRRLGQRSGLEDNQLNVLHLASHSHTGVVTTEPTASLNVSSNVADTDIPNNGQVFGAPEDPATSGPVNGYVADTPSIQTTTDVIVAGGQVTVGLTGQNAEINNMMPWISIYPIIALYGIYPSRS